MSEDQLKDWVREGVGSDIKEIKESIKEMGIYFRKSLEKIDEILTNLRVELAEDYVRKADYNDRIKNLYNKIDIFEKKVSDAKDECRIVCKDIENKLENHKIEQRNYFLKVVGIGISGTVIFMKIIEWVWSLAQSGVS